MKMKNYLETMIQQREILPKREGKFLQIHLSQAADQGYKDPKLRVPKEMMMMDTKILGLAREEGRPKGQRGHTLHLEIFQAIKSNTILTQTIEIMLLLNEVPRMII